MGGGELGRTCNLVGDRVCVWDVDFAFRGLVSGGAR